MKLSLRFRAGMRSSMPVTRRRDRENKPLLALAAAAGVAAALIMASSGLSAAASQATGFRPATEWSSHLCLAGEFCAMGDVNGDGKADAIAFTQGGNPGGGPPGSVFVALSTGHSFRHPVEWSSGMCLAGEFCAMGDVNHDGKADAIAFTQGGNPGGGPPGSVFVALSTGHSFRHPVEWSSGLCLAGEFCAMGDVNHDGKADAIAFTQGGNPGGGPPGSVFVALSTGHSFRHPVEWSSGLCLAGEHCAVADVNGDGKADAIAFTQGGNPGGGPPGSIFVGLSTGHSFGPAVQWSSHMCLAGEACAMGDVNHDHKSDAIAFTQGGNPGGGPPGSVFVALSTGIT